MIVDYKHISDADRIKLMLAIEHEPELIDEVVQKPCPTLATTPQQIVHTQIAEADDCDECAGPDHKAFIRRLYEKLDLAQIAVIRREARGP